MFHSFFRSGLAFAAFSVLAFGAPTPVILISIDSLRADHLGCYGYRKISTPHIDSLARQGTIFYNIDASVPMTLPSHTSMLTSTYPFTHGVEENGEPIKPGSVTLAEALQRNGYRTAAFIGGYVLDSRFGLDQGFDFYDSPFHNLSRTGPSGAGEDAPDLRRPGDAVLRAASRWLEKNSGQPVFVFIHLYDLHQPYSRPASPGLSGYDTALGSVDEDVGKFLEFLDSAGLLPRALVILTSDHGESLGEHGERTHGYFIYQSTLRVPLLIHWPEMTAPRPARIDTPASLIDVAPTILQFVGIPEPPQFQGRSLFRFFDPKTTTASSDIYAESKYARDHLGCSQLRSLRAGKYKYIEAPKPELYDLDTDPGESRNLYNRQRAQALELQRRMHMLQMRHAPKTSISKTTDPEVITRLRSLGYLGSAIPPNGTHGSGPDPKDRLREYLLYSDAIRFAATDSLADAIRSFEAVLKQDKKNVLAHYYLAVCYYRAHRLNETVKELHTTLAVAPDYWRADELLGTIWLQQKDYARARGQFVHLLKIMPNDYGANFNLGILDLRENRLQEAARELQSAAKADPQSAQAHEALGTVLLKQGREREAVEEFQRAHAARPATNAR